MLCLEWGNLPLQIICNFKIASYQNILIIFDMFPKNDNDYFVAYFD